MSEAEAEAVASLRLSARQAWSGENSNQISSPKRFVVVCSIFPIDLGPSRHYHPDAEAYSESRTVLWI